MEQLEEGDYLKSFENTFIALPSIEEQRKLIAKILEIRKMQRNLEEQMQKKY